MIAEEIHPTLAGLRARKGELLRHLLAAHNTCPRLAPFNANKAWAEIETVARFYLIRKMTRDEAKGPTGTELTTRAKSLAGLAEALRAAGAALADVARSGDGETLAQEWFEETRPAGEIDLQAELAKPFTGTAIGVFNYHDGFDNAATELAERLTTFEAAARSAFQVLVDAKAGSGAPRSSPLPFAISALAAIWPDATGDEPRAGKGAFQFFVEDFLTAVGEPSRDSTVLFKAIQGALSPRK